MNNQNPANNNLQFEDFVENLHSLTDEELQSIYGGIGANAEVAGIKVDVGVSTSCSVSSMC